MSRKTTPSIDFVISVRNRENERIQRCVNSLQSPYTGKIIVVDYCSDVPVDVKGCKVIRLKGLARWNKSHALNIGLKACKSEFASTIDCDMVIPEDFMEEMAKFISENTFIFTRNVHRVEVPETFDWGLDWGQILKLSKPWVPANKIHHFGVGGIQIFPRKWINLIKGYDESMFYWGGMDNDIYERAIRSGLVLIDINKPIFHQEHINQKEDNLSSEKEKLEAAEVRAHRREYLMAKEKQNIVMGPARWGGKYPNRKLHVEVVEDVKRKELNEKIKEIMSTKKNVSSEELSKLTGTKCTVVRPEDKK